MVIDSFLKLPNKFIYFKPPIMANWQPDNNSLMQVIQLLKESQFPCNETQRAIQQVTKSHFIFF